MTNKRWNHQVPGFGFKKGAKPPEGVAKKKKTSKKS